eukprot:2995720-Rhodomonas_salina.3
MGLLRYCTVLSGSPSVDTPVVPQEYLSMLRRRRRTSAGFQQVCSALPMSGIQEACDAGLELTLVIAFCRRKWKSLVAGASSGENQDVVSFLQTHPCFARSKNAEISTLLSQGRSINLEPNSVLFRAGD